MVQHAAMLGVAWHLPICLLGISEDTLAHPQVKDHLSKVILHSWQRATSHGSVERVQKIRLLVLYRYWHIWIENVETVLNSAIIQNHLGISVSWARSELMLRVLTALWNAAKQKVQMDQLGQIVVANHCTIVSKTYLSRWLYFLIAKLEKVESLQWQSNTSLVRATFAEWVECYCYSMKSRRLQEHLNQKRRREYFMTWRESVYTTKLSAIQHFVRPLSCIRKWKRAALWKHNELKLTQLSRRRMFLEPAFCVWRRKYKLSKQIAAVTALVHNNKLTYSLRKWRTRCKLRVRLADAAFNAWAASDQATGVFSLKLEHLMRISMLRSSFGKIRSFGARLSFISGRLSKNSCKSSCSKTLSIWRAAIEAIRRRSLLGEICRLCFRLRKPEAILQSEKFKYKLKTESLLKGLVMRSSVRKSNYTSLIFSDWLEMSKTRRKYKDQLNRLRAIMATRYAARYFACWKQAHDSSKTGSFCLHVRSLIFLQDVIRQWYQWALTSHNKRAARCATLSDYIRIRRLCKSLMLWAVNFTDNVRLRNNGEEISMRTSQKIIAVYYALWRRAHVHKICLTNIRSNLSTKQETNILTQTFEIWARQFASHVTIRREFSIFFETRRKLSLQFIWRQFVNVTKLENIGSKIFNQRLLTKSFRALQTTSVACKRNTKLANILTNRIYLKSLKFRCFARWRRVTAVNIAIRTRGDAIAASRYHCTCQTWVNLWFESADRWGRIRQLLEGEVQSRKIEFEETSFPSDDARQGFELTELDTYNISESSAELSRWPTTTEHYMHGMTEVEPLPSESQFYSFNTTATSAYSQPRNPSVSKEHLMRLLLHCIPDPRTDQVISQSNQRGNRHLANIMKRRTEVLQYHMSSKPGGKGEECNLIESTRYIFASKSDWISSFYLKKILFEKRLTRLIYVAAFSPKSRGICNPVRLTRLSNQYRVKLIRPWFANWKARARQNQQWAQSSITVNVMMRRYFEHIKSRAWQSHVVSDARMNAICKSIRLCLARECFYRFKVHGLRYTEHLGKLTLIRVTRLNKCWKFWWLLLRRMLALKTLDTWIIHKSIERCVGRQRRPDGILVTLLHDWRRAQQKTFLKLSVAATTLTRVIYKGALNNLRLNIYFKRWIHAYSFNAQANSMLELKIQEVVLRRILQNWRDFRLVVRIKKFQMRKYLVAMKRAWQNRQWSNTIVGALVRNRLSACLLTWSHKVSVEKACLEILIRRSSEVTLYRAWRDLTSWVGIIKVKSRDCEVCSKFWRGSRILKLWMSQARVARGVRLLSRVLERFAEIRFARIVVRALKERNIRFKLTRLYAALSKIKTTSSSTFDLNEMFTHWRRLSLDNYRHVVSAHGIQFRPLIKQWYHCLRAKLDYKDDDGRKMLSDCLGSWLQYSLRSKSGRQKQNERGALILTRWRVRTVDRLCRGRMCTDRYKLARMKNSLLCWQLATQMIHYEVSAAHLARRKLQLLDYSEVLYALRTHSVVAVWWREISQLTNRWQNRYAVQSARSLVKDWRRAAQRARLGTTLLSRRFVGLEEKSFQAWRQATQSTMQISMPETPIESPESNQLIELSMPHLPELRSNAARSALRTMAGTSQLVINEVVDEEQLQNLGFVRTQDESIHAAAEAAVQQKKNFVTTECSTQSVALRPATNAWLLRQARLRQVWLKWRVAYHRKKKRLNTSISSIGERSLVVADEWSPQPTPQINYIRDFLDREIDELEQMRSPPSFA